MASARASAVRTGWSLLTGHHPTGLPSGRRVTVLCSAVTSGYTIHVCPASSRRDSGARPLRVQPSITPGATKGSDLVSAPHRPALTRVPTLAG